jgi:hypothetical protein
MILMLANTIVLLPGCPKIAVPLVLDGRAHWYRERQQRAAKLRKTDAIIRAIE